MSEFASPGGANASKRASQLPAIKSGMLAKRSRNRNTHLINWSAVVGNWNDRMIYLFPTHIKYDAPNGTPKGIFPLAATSKVLVSDVDKKEFAFRITTETEDLYLDCPDEETRQSWMQAITVATDPETIAAATQAMVHEEKKRLSTAMLNDQEHHARLKAQEAERERRAALLKRMSNPAPCKKKLSTETSFNERYIWVETEKCEFHWGKNGEYTFHSKGVNLKTHVESVKMLTDTSFALILVSKEKLPEHLFRPGFVFDSSAPTSVDIELPDAEYCKEFVDILGEMKRTEGVIQP